MTIYFPIDHAQPSYEFLDSTPVSRAQRDSEMSNFSTGGMIWPDQHKRTCDWTPRALRAVFCFNGSSGLFYLIA